MIKAQLTFLLSFLFLQNIFAQKPLDVLSYQVQLQPDLKAKTIEGNVTIHFSIPPLTKEIILDCGQLTITNIQGKVVEDFKQKNRQLILSLSDQLDPINEIAITYHGKPKKGLVFLADPLQVYSVFFTSEWMVCNDAPNDKATFEIELILPDSLNGFASGILKNKEEIAGDLTKHIWIQTTPSPAYTYGFAIGKFNQSQEKHCGITLTYLAHHHSSKQLDTIFQYTGDMLSFFEEKSGIPYFQNTYTQVLMGRHYQEMAGCTLLKNTYGELVLKDSTETNLIGHELAHQWWGNQITCENWGHFWLNEGFATFMSAAYNEHRFGKAKYQADIDSYYGVYKKIKAKGKDKSLVFKDWLNPSQDDRNLVYFKGAYVLHLLRLELGDKAFWEGIEYFSLQYFGKSVNTQQFQKAMEVATNKDLQGFFEEWVY